jgi:peptidoglycan-associated lipoprotein
MRIASSSLIGLLLLPACRSRAPEAEPAPLPAPAVSTSADSAGLAARAQDSLARLAARRSAREAAFRGAAHLAMLDTIGMRVHFEFDRADLMPEDRVLLDRKVAILRSNPNLSLQIAGHCDERGSDEYNLALGNRRAATVQTYLAVHGIPENRLRTVSYGEERPLYNGATEVAWAENRRGEFLVVSVPDTLQRP